MKMWVKGTIIGPARLGTKYSTREYIVRVRLGYGRETAAYRPFGGPDGSHTQFTRIL